MKCIHVKYVLYTIIHNNAKQKTFRTNGQSSLNLLRWYNKIPKKTELHKRIVTNAINSTHCYLLNVSNVTNVPTFPKCMLSSTLYKLSKSKLEKKKKKKKKSFRMFQPTLSAC